MFVATLAFAQTSNNVEATRTGKTYVGANTSSLGFTTVDKVTSTAVALEAGKFVADDLALVGTVGYRAINSEYVNLNQWTYGVGAKYYIASQFPVQLDYNGTVGNGPTESYIGLQLGYAWFPWKNISIEPRLRQDFSLDRTEYSNRFSGAVGVNLHF